jgi:tRNA-specific 2-thiouridylase
MNKVVVGISGGVDSSVAALLLKQAGYEVIGLYMINWHDPTGTLMGDCPWKDDLIFAELVAKKLDIPLHVVDFSEEYRKRVVDYMFVEYEKGRTPNPDVLCNREVKFDLFLDKAMELGADYIATGHYCKKETEIINSVPVYKLFAGDDPNKDQSYFLCQLSQKQLEKALFPIGHMLKPNIRKLAVEYNLPTAERKDSQGICFVGKVDLPEFLQQKLKPKKGYVIEIPVNAKVFNSIDLADYKSESIDEKVEMICTKIDFTEVPGYRIGGHNGAHYYTIGQRKGLNIGGKVKPLYVIDTHIEKNIIYTGEGDDHAGLYRQGLLVKSDDIHWIRQDLKMENNEKRFYDVRIRYRQPLQKAVLLKKEAGIYIVFEKLQRGVSPGQFAAWYVNSELQGSGVIA